MTAQVEERPQERQTYGERDPQPDQDPDEITQPHVVICRDPEGEVPTSTRGVFPDAIEAWQYAEQWRERLAGSGVKLEITTAVILPPVEPVR